MLTLHMLYNTLKFPFLLSNIYPVSSFISFEFFMSKLSIALDLLISKSFFTCVFYKEFLVAIGLSQNDIVEVVAMSTFHHDLNFIFVLFTAYTTTGHCSV